MSDRWYLKGDEETGLWIGPITKQTHEELKLSALGDDFGYWLYTYAGEGAGSIVYAKFADEDAAVEFAEREGFTIHSIAE